MDTIEAATKRELFAAMVKAAIKHALNNDRLVGGVELQQETLEAIAEAHVQKWLRKYDAAPDGMG